MSTPPILADRVWCNARVMTARTGSLPHAPEAGQAIACRDGHIVAIGPDAEILAQVEAVEVLDLQQRLVTPGLVDCHTHLVYAGSRAGEFEQRLAGVSYAEISAAGGGIRSTVRATRAASPEVLLEASEPRLTALMREGVTTVEIKSGYGLSLEHELKQLRVARALGQRHPVRVATTLLSAHSMPPDATIDADAYIDEICETIIPAAAAEGLADAVDGFLEHIAFDVAQCDRVLSAAKKAGLAVKLHAGQLSDMGGAALAARHQALSADHLEYASEAEIAAMAAVGTVAVLLPGAFYLLRETQRPPVDLLRRHGVPIAVATDCNPGTSPLTSPLLAMNMAATLFGLTVDECLAGFTREGARALGLGDAIGTLEVGKVCDLAIWDVDAPAELVYRLGFNPLHARVWSGHVHQH